MRSERKNFFKIDWILVLVYFFLICFGLANIISSSISGENISLLDFSTLYGKQFVFIIISFVIIIISLSIEVKFYERFFRETLPGPCYTLVNGYRVGALVPKQTNQGLVARGRGWVGNGVSAP